MTKISVCAIAGVILALVFNSCSKSTVEPESNVILTLHVDANYDTLHWDRWIIAHDKNGNLLDFRPYKNGDEITLATTREVPDNKISVTQLTVDKLLIATIGVQYSLTTYCNVDVGQEIFLKQPMSWSVASNPIGTFSVHLTNLPATTFYDISTQSGGGTGDWASEPDLSFDASYYANFSRYFLSVTDENDNSRYKMFEGVQEGDEFNVGYGDLLEFDKTVSVQFPSTADYSFIISSLEEGQSPETIGYLTKLSTANPLASKTLLKGGYANRFASFQTSFSAKAGLHLFSYHKWPTPPDHDITFDAAIPFTIENDSLENFSMTPNLTYVYRVSSWESRGSGVGTFWSIISSESTHKLSTLPTEIATRYPDMVVKNISYKSTSLCTVSKPYQQFIDDMLKAAPLAPPDETKYIGLSVEP